MEKDAQKDMFDGSCLDSALLTIISPEPRAAESATGTLWEGLHSDIREGLSEAKSQECTTESSVSLQRLLRLTEQYPV